MRTKQRIDKDKEDFLRKFQLRKDKQSELARNYKKRVENFVINMIENPIVNEDYKGPTDYKIRDEFPEKFLKDPQVYIKGFKHEKDRIQESIERNQDLDYMPNQTVAHYNFRERFPGKEIQPDMRFTAKTSLERIEQLLKDHMQTQVENVDFRNKKKQHKFIDSFPENATHFERRTLMAKEIAKNLLPSLHNKTHFSAAQSLFNSCPVSLCDRITRSQPNLALSQVDNMGEQMPIESEDKDRQKNQGIKKSEETKGGSGNQGKKKEQKGSDQMEAFNPVETSKKVLKVCNVIREKNPKSKHIGMGQGHNISTLDKSISDVYLELYNKPVCFPQILK